MWSPFSPHIYSCAYTCMSNTNALLCICTHTHNTEVDFWHLTWIKWSLEWNLLIIRLVNNGSSVMETKRRSVQRTWASGGSTSSKAPLKISVTLRDGLKAPKALILVLWASLKVKSTHWSVNYKVKSIYNLLIIQVSTICHTYVLVC